MSCLFFSVIKIYDRDCDYVMKAIKHYFPVVLFIVLFKVKVVLAFNVCG